MEGEREDRKLIYRLVAYYTCLKFLFTLVKEEQQDLKMSECEEEEEEVVIFKLDQCDGNTDRQNSS